MLKITHYISSLLHKNSEKNLRKSLKNCIDKYIIEGIYECYDNDIVEANDYIDNVLVEVLVKFKIFLENNYKITYKKIDLYSTEDFVDDIINNFFTSDDIVYLFNIETILFGIPLIQCYLDYINIDITKKILKGIVKINM